MERKEYLKRCQECATLPQGIGRIKQRVPEDLRVKYKGKEYYPEAYMLAFADVDGYPIHTAILHELNENSIKHVPLSLVEPLF